jgi:hypothetical protein
MVSPPVLPFQTYGPKASHVEVVNGPAPFALDVESRKQLGVGVNDSSYHSIEVVELEILLAVELCELVTK